MTGNSVKRITLCRARFHLTIKKQLQTDEIEQDENVTLWEDYQKCEIPCGQKTIIIT